MTDHTPSPSTTSGSSMARRDDAFVAFVHARSPRLRLIARALTGDAGLADDLVQEALERTWLRWGSLDDDPFGWTRHVLVNLNVDRLRRRRVVEHPGEADLATALDLEARVLGDRWVAAVLHGLTPQERAVVVLRFLEDLTEADTAAELGIAVGTVKSTCHRALAKLRVLADQGVAR